MKLKALIATASAVAILSTPVMADSFDERESLTKILHELDSIHAITKEGEASANPDARIKFSYKLLRKDLQRVRMGIQEHLDAPTVEPRKYEPLAGDYRR